MKVLNKFSIVLAAATAGMFPLADTQAVAQVVTGVPGSPDTTTAVPESQSVAMSSNRMGAPQVEKEFDCSDLVVKRVVPVYPESAYRKGKEGWVFLTFTLDGSGRASEIQVIVSKPPGVFDRTTITALKQWEFQADAKRPTCQLSIGFGMYDLR